MSRRLWHWMLGAILAIALVGFLLRFSDTTKLNFSGFTPLNLLLISGAYSAALVVRAQYLRMTITSGSDISLRRWIGVAAQHQFLFTLAPSGLGDLGFPGLAERLTGIDAGKTLPALIAMRFRDVLLLAAAGLAGLGQVVGLNWPFLVLSLGMLAIQFSLPLFPRFIPKKVWRSRWIPTSIQQLASSLGIDQRSGWSRIILPGLMLPVAWSLSLLAILFAFQTVSFFPSIWDLLFIVAALNVVGAVGLTVAGLGVSEAGLAGALIVLGVEPAAAAAVALSVRPLVLVSNLLASAGLYVFYRFVL